MTLVILVLLEQIVCIFRNIKVLLELFSPY